MPVDDINTTNAVLPTALQGRTQTSVPLASSPLNLVKNPVAVATAATENLTPAQQAALAVTQATQTLTAPLSETETTLTATTATPTATPSTETTATNVGLPPAQQAAAQAIPYRNALAVYEVRNPTPPPAEPLPTRKDLHPPLPIGRVRPVDPLVLRKEWEKRKKAKHKETGHGEDAETRPPLKEKSIRDLVRQANEDLLASGVPLQLVLVKNEEGFALDIYDCSDDVVCEVEQEVPLDLNNLLTVLDNLEHEAGIIVNIKT